MGEEDDFERLMASLGDVLAHSDDDRSLGGGLRLPSTLDVAAIRHKTGLSQAAFAHRIGIPVGTIRNWEQGRQSPQGPARAAGSEPADCRGHFRKIMISAEVRLLP